MGADSMPRTLDGLLELINTAVGKISDVVDKEEFINADRLQRLTELGVQRTDLKSLMLTMAIVMADEPFGFGLGNQAGTFDLMWEGKGGTRVYTGLNPRGLFAEAIIDILDMRKQQFDNGEHLLADMPDEGGFAMLNIGEDFRSV